MIHRFKRLIVNELQSRRGRSTVAALFLPSLIAQEDGFICLRSRSTFLKAGIFAGLR